MDLTLRTESFGAGDQTWLGSAHGTSSARTVTINKSTLTDGTHYTNGQLKSGFPVAIVSNKAVPYNSGGTGGTNILAGFILTDQSVKSGGGDIVAPMLDHGRVRLSKLPFAVAATATTTGQFVFV